MSTVIEETTIDKLLEDEEKGGFNRYSDGSLVNKIVRILSLKERAYRIPQYRNSAEIFVRFENLLWKVSIWITSKRSIDLYYQHSEYVKSDSDVKKVAIVIGLKSFESAVKKNKYLLDKALVERMFNENKLVFFLSKDEKKLFAYTSPKYQEKYGPFKEVSSLKALKKFGINVLEETIEKGSVMLHGHTN